MSPASAAKLEQRLEDEGTLSLDKQELAEFFDFRARKLVGTSGTDALKHIRAGTYDSDPAWTELALLSALLK